MPLLYITKLNSEALKLTKLGWFTPRIELGFLGKACNYAYYILCSSI